MKVRKIVSVELNEVPWRILDYYCENRPKSCLAQIVLKSKQYETTAADSGHLSPWITWPTIHRGVINDQHGIYHLGQDLSKVDGEFPPIWQLLTQKGITTSVCGSLHSYPVPKDLENYRFYLPDAFAATPESYPPSLSHFQDFNLAMSRASARNVSRGVAIRPALNLARRLPSLGIKATTLFDIGIQLGREVFNPIRRSRRRSYQSVLAFDVFIKKLQETKPDFSTIFSNHVASAMHRYWAASFPSDYKKQEMDDRWMNSYKNEINFAMDKFDDFLTRLVDFVQENPEYQLMVLSSMGQAATSARHVRKYLTITNLPIFLSALGLGSGEWQKLPAMAPDLSIEVSPSRTDHFRDMINNFSIKGERIVVGEHANRFHFRVYIEDYSGPPQARIHNEEKSFDALGLGFFQNEDEVACTAYHIPEGSMFIYDAANEASGHKRGRASTLDIAPSILNHFSIAIPDYMHGQVLPLFQ